MKHSYIAIKISLLPMISRLILIFPMVRTFKLALTFDLLLRKFLRLFLKTLKSFYLRPVTIVMRMLFWIIWIHKGNTFITDFLDKAVIVHLKEFM